MTVLTCGISTQRPGNGDGVPVRFLLMKKLTVTLRMIPPVQSHRLLDELDVRQSQRWIDNRRGFDEHRQQQVDAAARTCDREIAIRQKQFVGRGRNAGLPSLYGRRTG